jgi:hypothetical protein
MSLRLPAASRMTAWPVAVLPARKTVRISGFPAMAAPLAPTRDDVDHARREVLGHDPQHPTEPGGASSEGLTTTVLPASSAGATPRKPRWTGLFQGTITPVAPIGRRPVQMVPRRPSGRPAPAGAARPRREGPVRGLHGAVDVPGAAQSHLAGHLAGADGVDHRQPLRDVELLAGDEHRGADERGWGRGVERGRHAPRVSDAESRMPAIPLHPVPRQGTAQPCAWPAAACTGVVGNAVPPPSGRGPGCRRIEIDNAAATTHSSAAAYHAPS